MVSSEDGVNTYHKLMESNEIEEERNIHKLTQSNNWEDIFESHIEVEKDRDRLQKLVEEAREEGRIDAEMSEFIPQTVKLIQQAEQTRIKSLIEEMKKTRKGTFTAMEEEWSSPEKIWNQALEELIKRI